MRLLLFVVTVVLSHSLLAKKNDRTRYAFKNAGIVPNILPEAPKDILDVNFAAYSVCLGSKIPHTHTALRPTIGYNASRSLNYTLLMIDPDLPAAATPAYRSTLHWLVVNIPGGNLHACPNTVDVPGDNALGGCQIAPYFPACFYYGSGYRRYIFLLYAQNKKIDTTDRNLLQFGISRIRFSVSYFVSQGAKRGIGELVAGNYFVSSLDLNERFCQA